MAVDLILAGVFQGYYWASLQPWEVSVDGSQPFWILRVFAGLAMIAGQVLLLLQHLQDLAQVACAGIGADAADAARAARDSCRSRLPVRRL